MTVCQQRLAEGQRKFEKATNRDVVCFTRALAVSCAAHAIITQDLPDGLCFRQPQREHCAHAGN